MRSSICCFDFRSEVVNAKIVLFYELHTVFTEPDYCCSAIQQSFNWLIFDHYSAIQSQVSFLKEWSNCRTLRLLSSVNTKLVSICSCRFRFPSISDDGPCQVSVWVRLPLGFVLHIPDQTLLLWLYSRVLILLYFLSLLFYSPHLPSWSARLKPVYQSSRTFWWKDFI